MSKYCAACCDLAERDYLECQRCTNSYHYSCLDISPEEGNNFLDASQKWICLSCSNKQPKGKDPARPSTPTNLAERTFNVTRRKFNSRPESLQASVTNMPDSASRSDIQVMIRDEMRFIMDEFMEKFKNTLNVEIRELRDQITDFKDSLGFLSAQYDSMNSDMVAQNSIIKQLKTENQQLRSEVNVLSNRVRQMDQLSRSANLEIQCVPEHKAENVLSIVRQLGQSKDESHDKNVPSSSGISYHRFPKDPEIKGKWIEMTGRQNWFPATN
ncbi:hypothetical protein SFRURICE_020288 [Spodoptera frugiperda]|nr:hypothetical protein SFRURICE_020288 [Spodoptera frugiperda]